MKKQLQLVNASQAIKLKNAGFDFEVSNFCIEPLDEDSYIDMNSEAILSNYNNDCLPFESVSIPTVELALKWMREEKDIFCGCHPQFVCGKTALSSQTGYVGQAVWNESKCGFTTIPFKTYPEAASSLLDELIEMFPQYPECEEILLK